MTALTVAPDGNATEVRFWQKVSQNKRVITLGGEKSCF